MGFAEVVFGAVVIGWTATLLPIVVDVWQDYRWYVFALVVIPWTVWIVLIDVMGINFLIQGCYDSYFYITHKKTDAHDPVGSMLAWVAMTGSAVGLLGLSFALLFG